MAYNLIKQRLENNDIIILDGAIGAELEKKGAKMHKDLSVSYTHLRAHRD